MIRRLRLKTQSVERLSWGRNNPNIIPQVSLGFSSIEERWYNTIRVPSCCCWYWNEDCSWRLNHLKEVEGGMTPTLFVTSPSVSSGFSSTVLVNIERVLTSTLLVRFSSVNKLISPVKGKMSVWDSKSSKAGRSCRYTISWRRKFTRWSAVTEQWP